MGSGKNTAASYGKKRLLWLMAIPILVITGFQLYWLRDNYLKEKRNLELRSSVIFGETVRRLQAKKLKLDKVFNGPAGDFKIEMTETGPGRHPVMGDEMAGYLNDIVIHASDSLSGEQKTAEEKQAVRLKDSAYTISGKKGMIISMTNSGVMLHGDSLKEFRFERNTGHPGEIFRFLYGVDSLQDSLKIQEIDSACDESFRKEGIRVSYSITRSDRAVIPEREIRSNQITPGKITIGFAHPVTYEMHLQKTFGYLLGKLSLPALFSLFLVGITIFSFILLYRNLQRQRRLTEIKNEFIGNITHELKTPIATVGVAIEALKNFNAMNDQQRTREYLDISQNELQRLSLLVDKVLKLSMFEKKELELNYESFDLKGVVDEVVSSMKLQTEKQNASVSVTQEGDTIIQADRLHLLSVVFNLLDNALKYGNGHTTVKIHIREKRDKTELSVADNGIGIAQEYQEKIFEKFFRVPAGNTHNTKGYGLGLSYVTQVIQKHKGNIEVESQPGLGTKFIITLPKQQA